MQHMAWRRGYLAGVSVGVTTPHFGFVSPRPGISIGQSARLLIWMLGDRTSPGPHLSYQGAGS